MKCFVPALALIGAAAAAPQFIADTPEVQEAKIAFAEAFNKAARGSAIALQEAGVVTDPNDADYSPAAEAYVHVDVPAEPYVHIEPVCDEAGHCDGAAPAPVAPVQLPAPVPKAAPAVVPQQFVPAPAPVQQFAAPIQTSTAPVQQQQQVFNPFVPFNFNGQAVAPAQYAGLYANNGQLINPGFNPVAFNGFNGFVPQPVQQVPVQPKTGCFNHKGEGVPCFSTAA